MITPLKISNLRLQGYGELSNLQGNIIKDSHVILHRAFRYMYGDGGGHQKLHTYRVWHEAYAFPKITLSTTYDNITNYIGIEKLLRSDSF